MFVFWVAWPKMFQPPLQQQHHQTQPSLWVATFVPCRLRQVNANLSSKVKRLWRNAIVTITAMVYTQVRYLQLVYMVYRSNSLLVPRHLAKIDSIIPLEICIRRMLCLWQSMCAGMYEWRPFCGRMSIQCYRQYDSTRTSMCSNVPRRYHLGV